MNAPMMLVVAGGILAMALVTGVYGRALLALEQWRIRRARDRQRPVLAYGRASLRYRRHTLGAGR